MCVTCGCSNQGQATFIHPDSQHADSAVIESSSHSHSHTLADGTIITHVHDAVTSHTHSEMSTHHEVENHLHGDSDGGQSIYVDDSSAPFQPAAHIHAQTHSTTLTLEQHLLSKNNRIATQNRTWLSDRHIKALNLVSSPGAGKTTLLVKTIQDLYADIPITVIEGDQETAQDAKRIAATGCPTLQINTGTGCHLDAEMIEHSLKTLAPPANSLLLIENVGNLVCPALFDLGENAKVVILSVTEGDDKPIKYPHMFRASQVMVLTKIDLLPYVNFDVNRCLDYARQVNPALNVFQVSATSGAGLTDWYAWLKS